LKFRTCLCVILALAPLLVLARAASAQSAPANGSGSPTAPDAASEARAQDLFGEGRTLLSSGRYAEACPKLAESLRLDPAAGTAINLGYCYEKSGQSRLAWTTFRDAAAMARRAGRDNWVALAEKRADLLAAKLSMITVSIPDAAIADGMELRCDDAVIAASDWGRPIPVDPGSHRIEVTAPQRAPLHKEIDIGPAEHLRIDVPALAEIPTPRAASPAVPVSGTAPPVAPLRPAKSGWTQRTTAIGLGAVAGIGVVAGAVFGIWALVDNGQVESACPAGAPCRDQGAVGRSHEAYAAATASTVAFVAGAAFGVAGGVVFFTAPGASGRDEPRAAEGRTAAGANPWTSLRCTVSGGAWGVQCQGAF
jgi:hypothetical protein